MSVKRDHKWERILANAPRELLVDLAKKQPGHLVSEFSKEMEFVVDEVFRVCDAAVVQTLYEEFPGPHNFATWFYQPSARVTKKEVQNAVQKRDSLQLANGLKPEITNEPQIYRVESAKSTVLLRYVAADRNQRLEVEFGETETFRILSYYDCLFHFSEVVGLIFGPSGSHKADQVITEGDSHLRLNGKWELLKPGRGKSREFYQSAKEALGGLLIETKRHDPSGNYRTITLEARTKQPDLEQVPHFQKNYLDADSYYDVLEYRCKNKLGLFETTHVRFGRPFGRFTFKHGSSLSAILHFQEKISALLR
jgi:hypothetical protein